MAIAKLKVGDRVKVIAGSAKGSVGEIIKIVDQKIYVSGVNLRQKSLRIDKSLPKEEQQNYKKVEAPIHRSNVALYDADLQKTYKVSIQTQDGEKVRVNKKTGATLQKARS